MEEIEACLHHLTLCGIINYLKRWRTFWFCKLFLCLFINAKNKTTVTNTMIFHLCNFSAELLFHHMIDSSSDSFMCPQHIYTFNRYCVKREWSCSIFNFFEYRAALNIAQVNLALSSFARFFFLIRYFVYNYNHAMDKRWIQTDLSTFFLYKTFIFLNNPVFVNRVTCCNFVFLFFY